MNQQAKVTSIDALREFRMAMIEYRLAVIDSTEGLSLEGDRGVDWVQTDRPAYWPARTRRLDDELVAAKAELLQCQTRRVGDHQSSCIDEKKKVTRIKQQLDNARSKVKESRNWRATIEKDHGDFETRVSQLTDFAELEIPKAIAALERMIDFLDQYAAKGDRPTERKAGSPTPPPTGSDK